MKITNFKRFASKTTILTVIVALNLQPISQALAQSNNGSGTASTSGLLNLFNQPHLAGENIPPYVMITASKDQQLFKKAYDDYSDLNDDGVLDTTYNHNIDYYGYFDSYKCYTYSDGQRRYEPASITSNKYCSGAWSGNFLNWASMTRADALRKVLFGGLRSPDRSGTGGDADGINDGDTTSSTVLERAYLPYTAHAFTKYYDGADINQLTPFSLNARVAEGVSIAASNGVVENGINTNPHRVRIADASFFNNNDIVELRTNSGSFVRGRVTGRALSAGNNWIELGVITALNISGTASSNGTWTVNNISVRGITICNTTDGSNSGIQGLSNTNTNLPRMKIARGNFSLWNAQERWQCTWSEQRNASNGNSFDVSGVPAYSSSPSQNTYGLDEVGKGTTAGKGNYFVRVKACDPALLGKERCKQYADGNYKPIGLIQTLGETDRIRFGLVTGSYGKNISGGVLRKNLGKIDDEVNLFTGQFYSLPDSGVPDRTSPGDPNYQFGGGSIIKTLSSIRITGYEYNGGNFFGGMSDDNCNYQRRLDTNGACKSWGNPISELYYEVLRYYGGQTAATAAFEANDSGVIKGLAKAQWPTSASAVLSSKNFCAPVNALVINASTNTNEADNQIGSLSFMEGNPPTATVLTNSVGQHWDLNGGTYFFGARNGDSASSAGYNSCTAKSLTGLGDVLGICPEGPTYGGSYHIAGLAYRAHTHRIRTDITLPASASKLKRPPLRMDTYGVSLNSGAPAIPIKFSGDSEARATLQPSYRLVNGSSIMGGALVDIRILYQIEGTNRSEGRLLVSFEDSEGGGDYDMDVWGIMTYVLEGNVLKVTTDAVYQATGNPQGFGYIISGTNADGQHFHSGIHGFTYNDATPNMAVVGTEGRINNTGGCNGCQVNDGPSTATYTLQATQTARRLEEPLWYASLFGGFDDSNDNGRPDKPSSTAAPYQLTEYDRRDNKTGADTPDGIPDNFFKVSNPLGLEVGLERTFQLISEQSSLSAVASSSTRVKVGTTLYEAKFNSGDWSGELQGQLVDPDTGKPTQVVWSASSQFNNSFDQNSRVMITSSDQTRTGVPFRWDSISATQKTLLNTTPGGQPDDRGEDRVKYLRGSGQHEGLASGNFRQRISNKLGDIVNSNPVYVGKPNSGYAESGYRAFTQTTRIPMIYVGGNDGALHGFNANTGKELLAFIPSQVYGNLSRLTMQDYSHRYFVDGQITTGDVQIGSNWKTYLVSALGKGGQGVFALDVTNPANFSEANAAQTFKWEFTDKDDPEMGYVMTEPLIRKMPNGKWAALVSAGYNATEPDGNTSTSGKAHLFVLFLDGPTGPGSTWVEGSDYVKIPLGSTVAAKPNGLGGIATWDIEGDNVVDYAYAGDIKGAMWRVKFTGASPSGWTAANSIYKLFQANNGTSDQPITAAPLLVNGPNYQGAMVIFGTGKLLEASDVDSITGVATGINSMYGILDRFTSSNTVVRSNLMKQVMLDNETTDGIKYSLLSAFIPNYGTVVRSNARFGYTNPLATGPTATTNPQSGWYLDAPNSNTTGERVIYQPMPSGSIVVFSNAIPSSVPCDGGGSEARYALDIFTGGRAASGGFDRNSDGNINTADLSSFSIPSSGNGSTPAKYFSSRREQSGGYGQVTILKQGTGGAPGTGLAGTEPCARALAVSSASSDPDALPGGCAARIQWRETLSN